MPLDIQAHRQRMVDHFLWLETAAPPGYAVQALELYRTHPDCPCPDILTDVKAEKQRRQHASTGL
jgi:hypothetical protein